MKLNELKQRLQGKNKLITKCLFLKHFKWKNAIHFKFLNEFNSDGKNFSNMTNDVTKLIKAFKDRFSFIQKYEEMFTIFLAPFDVKVETALSDLGTNGAYRLAIKYCDETHDRR